MDSSPHGVLTVCSRSRRFRSCCYSRTAEETWDQTDGGTYPGGRRRRKQHQVCKTDETNYLYTACLLLNTTVKFFYFIHTEFYISKSYATCALSPSNLTGFKLNRTRKSLPSYLSNISCKRHCYCEWSIEIDLEVKEDVGMLWKRQQNYPQLICY